MPRLKKKDSNAINPEAREIGQLLKAARERAGMSQSAVAQVGGWLYEDGSPNQTQVSHYETGRRSISAVDLRRYAAAIGVSVGDIFEQRGESRHSVEERGFMALYSRAAPEARRLAEDVLQQPVTVVKLVTDLLWAVNRSVGMTGTLEGRYGGSREGEVAMPAAEKRKAQ